MLPTAKPDIRRHKLKDALLRKAAHYLDISYHATDAAKAQLYRGWACRYQAIAAQLMAEDDCGCSYAMPMGGEEKQADIPAFMFA